MLAVEGMALGTKNGRSCHTLVCRMHARTHSLTCGRMLQACQRKQLESGRGGPKIIVRFWHEPCGRVPVLAGAEVGAEALQSVAVQSISPDWTTRSEGQDQHGEHAPTGGHRRTKSTPHDRSSVRGLHKNGAGPREEVGQR